MRRPPVDRSYSNEFNRIITVAVGPARKEFVIHEEVAKANSDYFKHAIEGGWSEGESGYFELLDENPTVFAGFVNFIYNKNIASVSAKDQEMFLVESYLFGERRGSVAY